MWVSVGFIHSWNCEYAWICKCFVKCINRKFLICSNKSLYFCSNNPPVFFLLHQCAGAKRVPALNSLSIHHYEKLHHPNWNKQRCPDSGTQMKEYSPWCTRGLLRFLRFGWKGSSLFFLLLQVHNELFLFARSENAFSALFEIKLSVTLYNFRHRLISVKQCQTYNG